MKNYKVDWLFLIVIGWFFVIGFTFSLFFLNGIWQVLYWKVLAFFLVLWTPLLIVMAVDKGKHEDS